MVKNNFFRFLFQDKENLPSKEVFVVFKKIFPKAKNAEWVQKNEHFEVIFYEHDIEKIAEFDRHGNLLLLKTNINPAVFNGEIRKVADKYGEIMNVIKIEKDNNVQFEIIVRDIELTRFELLIDQEGKELKFGKL